MYIDNVKFARNSQNLSGQLDLGKISRVQEIGQYSGVLYYNLTGIVDDLNRPTLVLKIEGSIITICHNCLNNLELEINNVTPITIFFSEKKLDEALFNSEDNGIEDGILAEVEFNFMQLIEDEIIMLLPYVAKHDTCVGLNYNDQQQNSFAQLASLI